MDFALGGGGSLGGVGVRVGASVGQSTATSRGDGGGGGDGRSGRSAPDEEGLGLLRQQLSAVQRIRIEHERKDATIAALRMEVSVTGRAGGLAGCCCVCSFVRSFASSGMYASWEKGRGQESRRYSSRGWVPGGGRRAGGGRKGQLRAKERMVGDQHACWLSWVLLNSVVLASCRGVCAVVCCGVVLIL